MVGLALNLVGCANQQAQDPTDQTAAGAAGATVIGPDEVQRELVGKTWNVELPDGQSATENFYADGTVDIHGGLNDVGKWRLWEKGYCTSWSRMRKGAERCFTLDRTAEGHYRIYKPDGDISMTILGFK
jgi:hypothetical protein